MNTPKLVLTLIAGSAIGTILFGGCRQEPAPAPSPEPKAAVSPVVPSPEGTSSTSELLHVGTMFRVRDVLGVVQLVSRYELRVVLAPELSGQPKLPNMWGRLRAEGTSQPVAVRRAEGKDYWNAHLPFEVGVPLKCELTMVLDDGTSSVTPLLITDFSGIEGPKFESPTVPDNSSGQPFCALGYDLRLDLVSPTEAAVIFRPDDLSAALNVVWGTIRLGDPAASPVDLVRYGNRPYLTAKFASAVAVPAEFVLDLGNQTGGKDTLRVAMPQIEALKLDDGLTSVALPEAGVPITVGNQTGMAYLASRKLVVAQLDSTDGIGGFVMAKDMPETQKTFQPVPGTSLLLAELAEPVRLPFWGTANLFLGNSTLYPNPFVLRQLADPRSSEQAALAPAVSRKPEITTTALGLVVNGDTTVIGVLGKNLARGHIFIRSGNTEIEIPADATTDDSIAVLEWAVKAAFRPGVWDVVVRTPYGEAVVPKAVQWP